MANLVLSCTPSDQCAMKEVRVLLFSRESFSFLVCCGSANLVFMVFSCNCMGIHRLVDYRKQLEKLCSVKKLNGSKKRCTITICKDIKRAANEVWN